MAFIQLFQLSLHGLSHLLRIHGIHHQHQAVVQKGLVNLVQLILQGQKPFHTGLCGQIHYLVH